MATTRTRRVRRDSSVRRDEAKAGSDASRSDSLRLRAGLTPRPDTTSVKKPGTGVRLAKSPLEVIFGDASTTFAEMTARFRQERTIFEDLLTMAAHESLYRGTFRQGALLSIYRVGGYAASFTDVGRMGLHPLDEGDGSEPAAFDLEAAGEHNAFLRGYDGHGRYRNLARDVALLTFADKNDDFRSVYESYPRQSLQEYSGALMNLYKQIQYVRTEAEQPGSFTY